MTIDDETLRPGVAIRAVPWLAQQRRWGAPQEVACARLARLADLSGADMAALETPASAAGAASAAAHLVRALYPPGPPQSER
jgi:hypothetical protein